MQPEQLVSTSFNSYLGLWSRIPSHSYSQPYKPLLYSVMRLLEHVLERQWGVLRALTAWEVEVA